MGNSSVKKEKKMTLKEKIETRLQEEKMTSSSNIDLEQTGEKLNTSREAKLLEELDDYGKISPWNCFCG